MSKTHRRPNQRMEELLIAVVLALGMEVCGRRAESGFLAHCVSQHASACFAASPIERDRLLDLQGLLVLAVLSLYQPAAGLTWHHVGLAINRVISCSFHREPNAFEARELSQKVLDQRRDVFWSIYCLDRITSLALGKPVSIQNCDITAAIPGSDGGKESRDAFVLTKLLSEILRARGSSSSSYYCRLYTWKDANPGNARSYSAQYNEILYLQGLILLYETHPVREQVCSATAFEVMNACTRLIDIAH